MATSNIVWMLETICAYLQILSLSSEADVASGPQDTTQRGEEKKPGGRSTDAAALQRSHLELLRDLMGRTRVRKRLGHSQAKLSSNAV